MTDRKCLLKVVIKCSCDSWLNCCNILFFCRQMSNLAVLVQVCSLRTEAMSPAYIFPTPVFTLSFVNGDVHLRSLTFLRVETDINKASGQLWGPSFSWDSGKSWCSAWTVFSTGHPEAALIGSWTVTPAYCSPASSLPQRWVGCGSPWRSAHTGSSWCNPDLRGPAEPRWRRSSLLLSWTPARHRDIRVGLKPRTK